MSRDPNELWGEAVNIAVKDAMLERARFGRKSSIIKLKVFDCTSYAHVPKDEGNMQGNVVLSTDLKIDYGLCGPSQKVSGLNFRGCDPLD
jgi:hypothetical protein